MGPVAHARDVGPRCNQMGGKFLDAVERAVSMGQTLIIDNLTESLDPVIEPVLSRSTVKKGGMVTG